MQRRTVEPRSLAGSEVQIDDRGETERQMRGELGAIGSPKFRVCRDGLLI